MLSNEDEFDLEGEIYKLIGVKNLLNAWSTEDDRYESFYIAKALNEITNNIVKILNIDASG